MFFKWLASRFRKPASDLPPVVLSCHYHIETREGYNTYLEARRRGWQELPCRFLGTSTIENVRIDFLHPDRWQKTAAELERYI